jgi:uncharacterized membrane protein YfcA
MTVQQIVILVFTGLLAGLVSGTMGVGGAIIIVPFLVFFLGMSQHLAQGTSLAVLLFPVGIFAVLTYAKNGYINFKFAIILILAFLVGSYVGSLVAVNLPEKMLQRIFAVLLIVVGAKMLIGSK